MAAAEKRPKTSSTETALDVAGAALDLVNWADETGRGYTASEHVATLLRGAKELRGYQIEDVVGFVRGRTLADEEPETFDPGPYPTEATS